MKAPGLWMVPILLICAYGAAQTPSAFSGEMRRGILLHTLHRDGKSFGSPGQRVLFKQEGIWTVAQVDGSAVKTAGDIIPDDPAFAPARIYIEVTRNPNPGELPELIELARRAVEWYPSSPLADALAAQRIRLTHRLEEQASDGKMSPVKAIDLARDYLRRYPHGRNWDEIAWRLVVWFHEVYEYEGDPKYPLEQAAAYARFLSAHPVSPFAAEIREEMARRYRLASEFITYVPGSHRSNAEAKTSRERALRFYTGLLSTPDTARRARAEVALYNMRHGRLAGGLFGKTSPGMDW